MSQGGQCFPLARLKTVADVRPSGVDKHTVEGEIPVRLCNYVDVYKNDRITSAIVFMEASATQAEIERFTLVPGDVLITKDSETPDDIAAAALVEESAAGALCGYHLALLRPRQEGISGGFLFWCLKAPETLSQFSVRANGITRFGLTTAAMGEVQIPIPPPRLQSAIAAFLDRETGKIDALVAEQERLMALLKEKRQAVISQAVTKGLNPSAKMKPSGVEWLGEVPEHWERCRVKHMVTHVVDCLHTTPTYDGDLQYPAIRTADVEPGRLLLDQARLVSEEVYRERIQRLRPIEGDIVYSREGERFGMAALVPAGIDLCLGQRMMMFRAAGHCDAAYLMWVLNSDTVYQQVLADLNGATSPHVNIGDVINFDVPCPPLGEQESIAMHIAGHVADCDALLLEADQAIALLKERRAALLSAAVTGKIDVRGVADTQRDAA